MNIRRRCVAILVLALSFSGCGEKVYKVSTVISTDGTCERVITVRYDSKSLARSAFPIPMDSTWRCEWTLEKNVDSTSKHDDSVYIARKRFADFEALGREYNVRRDSTNLAIHVAVERRFRWFYTYYDYSETYARFDPLHVPVPPSAVMTEEDLRQFMSSEAPDSALKGKWKRWDERNTMEWAFGRFVDAVRMRNDPKLSVDLVEQNKDRLIALLSDDSTKGKVPPSGKARTEKGRRQNDHRSFSEKLVSEMALMLKTDAVRALASDLDSIGVEANKRMEVSGRDEGEYINTVVMPGVIIATNASEVRGTTVVWRFTHEHLALMDYPMHVESRVINLWAIIVTALVVLCALAVPAFLRRRAGL